MDAPGVPEEERHFELADWRWDPHTLVRHAALPCCPVLAAGAAFDALTRWRFAALPSQVAELASGAIDAPATAADAVPTSPPAASLRRTSPPAPLRCQVPSCSLPLDTLRVYNQRSRCGATRRASASSPSHGAVAFLATARATARGCDGGRRRGENAPMRRAQRPCRASKVSCALMAPRGALSDSCPTSLRRPGCAWSTCERRRCCWRTARAGGFAKSAAARASTCQLCSHSAPAPAGATGCNR